jgi:diguanylate cyclase (GGDEF)-like protein
LPLQPYSMDASPLLIECVAATTNHRDRDDIELSMVQLLLQFLAADSVTLFKLRHEAGVPRATHCLAATRSDSGVEIARGLGNVESIATRELWRDCIDSAEPQQATRPCGGYEILLPLHGDNRSVLGLVEVLGQRCPEPRELMLINGVLRIVRNHLALLDYGERDTLTGLLNRKTFEAQFEKLRLDLAADAYAHVDNCWIGVLDIDHFKLVNDGFGHVIGDEVLLMVSQVIQRNFRVDDRIYRFGGEEFVVLLRDTPEAATAAVMERLRAAVAAHRFPQLGTVTVSIGWTRIRPQDAPASAMRRADAALYHAKQKGRNSVFQYELLVAQGELEGETPALEHEIELF